MSSAKGRRKICVAVHSRANYGRIKSVMQAIKANPDLELQIIVGASGMLQRFGAVVNVLKQDGFEPNATVYSILEGETPTTMAKSTGLAIMELATQFENLQPDVVITVADRFETIATAIAASYMNIPVAHTQGGEVTGSIDESVRHAVTKLSHIHFPATEQAREFIIRMGEDPSTVHFTGCPSIDAIADIDYSQKVDLFSRYAGVGAKLDPNQPYIVVLQHPVTTEYGQGLDQINETLNAVHRLGMQTAWLWPNVDAGSDDISKGIRRFREKNHPEKIHFYINFAVEDYARLINGCACLVGNSSSALREGAFLGVPAVNIGTRQSGREHAANVMHVGHSAAAIEAAIKKQIAHGRYQRSTMFGDGKAGQRIADLLATADLHVQKQLAYR
jgi:UDP-hydrolysing UDP-N-acetyl-D-glucosamine 2-epimerase